jgi:hypothetical protein
MSRFKRDGLLHWLVCAGFSVGVTLCVNGGNSNEAFAQGDLFVYPSKGQSNAQRDKYNRALSTCLEGKGLPPEQEKARAAFHQQLNDDLDIYKASRSSLLDTLDTKFAKLEKTVYKYRIHK